MDGVAKQSGLGRSRYGNGYKVSICGRDHAIEKCEAKLLTDVQLRTGGLTLHSEPEMP